MKHAVLVNYNFDPKDWWLEYGFEPENVYLYDRSDDGIERTFAARTYKTANVGDVDYDKLGHLVQHYDSLPETFLWAKTNLLDRFVTKEYFKKALQTNEFTPLLKFDHKTYSDQFGQVNYYSGNMYHERADSWFFNANVGKYFHTWQDWCLAFGLPRTAYIPFPPGGNFILTKDRVHRYSRDLYDHMRETLPHCQRPAEAQAAERSYYLLFK